MAVSRFPVSSCSLGCVGNADIRQSEREHIQVHSFLNTGHRHKAGVVSIVMIMVVLRRVIAALGPALLVSQPVLLCLGFLEGLGYHHPRGSLMRKMKRVCFSEDIASEGEGAFLRASSLSSISIFDFG